jgi:RNA polymerase sigma-70 factor (ECF subfamily)
MSDDSLFRDLIRRARSGDSKAEVELVRVYEPEIRRVVRARLREPTLRNLLDSTDICQSVLASFFARIVAGKYVLETADQLRKLLRKMAVNKLINQILREHAQRRGGGKVQVGLPEGQDVLASGPSPSKVAAIQDSAEAVRKHLTREEHQIAHLRSQGHSWEQIAERLGGDPDTLRMRYNRAIRRVRREMGEQG